MDYDISNGVDSAITSNSLQSEGGNDEEEQALSLDGDQRVYLVPFRWWKEAQDSSSTELRRGIPYVASPASGGPMKLLNIIFNPDIVFNLRKEEDLLSNGDIGEVGVSGRDYALIPGKMWLQTLKWHSNYRDSSKETKYFSSLEDMSDVYPLQFRLSHVRETNGLSVKISKKDNSVECFKRACKLFNVEETIRFWDFSGHTMLLLLNENNKIINESHKQTDQELLLDLQVYGLTDSVRNRGARKDEFGQYPNGTSYLANGFSMNASSSSSRLLGNSFEYGTLGLTGLQNLGNTCFMNSALQCLAHTPKLVDFFLGDYRKEINTENPLGMNGEIALSFGDLLKKLWAPGATPLAPRTFKLKLAHFAPQFSGFNQHDSQELLAFLLDGLHEDLNRVRRKPYFEAKDSEGRPDEEVADEYWRNHLARNDSIIVDAFQGQYRSTLVCPICRKVSVTFDPFMYLSLPLPSTSLRTMTVTIVKTDGSKPSPFTVTVPKNGRLENLTRSLSTACSLGVDETLLVAEIYNNRIIRYLEEPTDSLSLIRDDDRLVAYKISEGTKEAPLFVFMHQQFEDQYIGGRFAPGGRVFGIPLVMRKNIERGSDILEVYKKSLAPFLVPDEDCANNSGGSEGGATEVFSEANDNNARFSGSAENSGEEKLDAQPGTEFQFYLTDEKVTEQGPEIRKEEMLNFNPLPGKHYVLVSWPKEKVERYDLQPLRLLPEVFKSGFFSRRPAESVYLYKCLEGFLKEEPLGPEDMWFCPVCKKHCQASKKLDLWRLPEILVIHLKRFSYSRFLKNKLDAYVDFPIHDLDLSAYITRNDGESSNRYMLYAVSNHYGSMGGGHYTAFVRHDGDQWYEFDDSRVSPIGEDKIKSPSAYVLFYRRV